MSLVVYFCIFIHRGVAGGSAWAAASAAAVDAAAAAP
jgi:hypothetical protein